MSEDAFETLRDGRSIRQLLNRLAGASDEDRAGIVTQLREMRSAALPILFEALDSERRDLRVATALVLGELGVTTALDPLIAMVESDPDPSVQPIALRAVTDLADSRAGKRIKLFLLERLQHEDMFQRALACRGLGRIGDGDCLGALKIAMRDREDWVRSAARKALSGATAASPGLASCTSGPARALAVIPPTDRFPQQINDLRSLDPERQRTAQRSLEAAGEAAVPAVAPLLWDESAATRRAAAELLGKIAGPRSAEPLIEALRDPACDPGLRAVGLHSLGTLFERHGDSIELSGFDPLGYLEDDDRYTRAAAAVCAIRAGGDLRRTAVVAIVDDDEEWVHAAALAALSRVASAEDRLLRDVLVDALGRVVDSAALVHLFEALAGILQEPLPDDQIVIGPVSYFLEHENRHVQAAALTLTLRVARRIEGDLLHRLARLLDADPAVGRPVASALASNATAGDAQPLALLSRLMRSSDAQTAADAARALVEIATPPAIDILIEAANGDGQRNAAVAALQSIPANAEVSARCDDGGFWQRQLRPRCTCPERRPLQWLPRTGREELRCPACDSEFVISPGGRVFRADRTPFGLCLCCKRKQPLVREGTGEQLRCPVSDEVHVRPYDFPRQLRLLSQLPLGACRCCSEPQPLIRVGERVVCYRTRQHHIPGADGFDLPHAEMSSDIDAINEALLRGTLAIGQSGMALTPGRDSED